MLVVLLQSQRSSSLQEGSSVLSSETGGRKSILSTRRPCADSACLAVTDTFAIWTAHRFQMPLAQLLRNRQSSPPRSTESFRESVCVLDRRHRSSIRNSSCPLTAGLLTRATPTDTLSERSARSRARKLNKKVCCLNTKYHTGLSDVLSLIVCLRRASHGWFLPSRRTTSFGGIERICGTC